MSGQLTTSGTFSSSSQIFNRNDSFYTPGAIVAQQARQGLRQFLDSPAGSPGLDNAQARVVSRLSSTPLHVDYGAAASSTVMPQAHGPSREREHPHAFDRRKPPRRLRSGHTAHCRELHGSSLECEHPHAWGGPDASSQLQHVDVRELGYEYEFFDSGRSRLTRGTLIRMTINPFLRWPRWVGR